MRGPRLNHPLYQSSFPFFTGIPKKAVSPKSVGLIKVVSHTLKEISRHYKAMQEPKHLVEFWYREIASSDWFDPEKEHLVVVCLDSKLKVKAFNLVSVGLNNQTLLHAREVFRPAISVAASSVIIMHNHPSGDPTPSADDICVTRETVKAGKILGIACLDSLIVGRLRSKCRKEFVSLKQAGLMSFE